MNRIYPKAKEASWDWVNDDIRAILVDLADYTPNFSTDDNLDDIPGAARVGSAVALTGKTNTLGVLDADDVTFTAVTGDECEAVILYKHTGTESTSKLFTFIDGKFQVEIAEAASTGATTIKPEDLPEAIPSSGVLTLISGTGPATITTSASGAAGARSLSVTALSSGITAGAVYEYMADGTGLPITPNSGDIKIAWSAGSYKIAAL
jgi:hypothetical protein